MDDSVEMSCIEPITDLQGILQQLFHLKRLQSNSYVEWVSLEQFHADKVLPVVFTDLIYGTNRRMIERRSRACFLPEAFESRILRHGRRQQFQRDQSSEAQIFLSNDHTHATRPTL